MSNHNDDEFDDIDEPIRAEREIVRFFDGLEVDGYRMPNLEFRVGLSGASRVLGYDRDWLRDILQTNARTVKSLRGLGFSEQTQKVTAQSKHQNSFEDTTLFTSPIPPDNSTVKGYSDEDSSPFVGAEVMSINITAKQFLVSHLFHGSAN